MATYTVTEYVCPPKKRRLDKASGESTSFATRPYPRYFDANDDECIRQYILYYYQFHKSDVFPCSSLNIPVKLGLTAACRVLVKHNAEKGTRLVYLDHVSASFIRCSGVIYHITFWALDLASSNPEPKIYQTKCHLCGAFCDIYIFRLRPTDEEIAAVQVDPPPPLYDYNSVEPTVLFTVTGPGSGSIPNVVFTRIPAEVSRPQIAEADYLSGQNPQRASQWA